MPDLDRRSLVFRGLLFPGAVFSLLAGRASAQGRTPCPLTQGDEEGPYYIPGAPLRRTLAGPKEPGDRIVIRGTVLGPDCRIPLAGALLDVWQADAAGRYHGENEEYRLRGQVRTDRQGRYEFETVRPGNYDLGDGLRPAHIHFTVTHPAHRPVTTQLYFRGDPHLAPNDPCGRGCNSDDPDRIVDLAPEKGVLAARFDVKLAARSAARAAPSATSGPPRST